jgi:hypothetical protein
MAAGPYFSTAALMGEARKETGLSDWGDDDFLGPFERFIEALNSEAELSDQGLARTHSYLLRMLTGRLKLYQDRKAWPQIASEEIKKPLFITGLGRSGTSYLHALLACDPRHHALFHWQIWTLSPPPNHPSTDNAPQRAAGERYIRCEGWQDEGIRDKHDYSSEGAAEDTLIQDYAFVSRAFPAFWSAPSYGAWVASADFAPTYRLERKILQALQFGQQRDRWVLKSPLHLSQLGYLFAEFLDAQIIVNHRDPVKSLASTMSLVAAHKVQFGGPPSTPGRAEGLAVVEGAAQSLEDMIRRRQAPEAARTFVDVQYLDLERDPLAQVAKVYAHFAIELTDDVRGRMLDYVAENRKGKFGVHRYHITDTGLRVEEVRERFKFYTDTFDIPYEA